MNEPLRYSTSLSYKSAVQAKAAGDLTTARIEYSKCLEEAERASAEPYLIADLRLRLGDVEALDEHKEVAMKLYETAVNADPLSPLVLIQAAQSHMSLLANPTVALTLLDRAEDLIESGVWRPTDDDLSETEYRARIASTRVIAFNGANEA